MAGALFLPHVRPLPQLSRNMYYGHRGIAPYVRDAVQVTGVSSLARGRRKMGSLGQRKKVVTATPGWYRARSTEPLTVCNP